MVIVIAEQGVPTLAVEPLLDAREALLRDSFRRLSGSRSRRSLLTLVAEVPVFGDALHVVSDFDFDERPLRPVRVRRVEPDDSDW